MKSVFSPNEFLLVQGFCAWEKQEKGSGGILGQLLDGNFEKVAKEDSITEQIWNTLKLQSVLSEKTSSKNFDLSLLAWERGNDVSSSSQEESGPVVYDSSISVSKLADKALWHWISIFILRNVEYYDY